MNDGFADDSEPEDLKQTVLDLVGAIEQRLAQLAEASEKHSHDLTQRIEQVTAKALQLRNGNEQ